ncbi:Proteasome activator complex subunit 3 [Toxocara canis]|uniref:Proteasome activator complex subunit 3 n=1 Tax=Toxocara canis TaxID=6265 RepID=A0A0B2VEL2_TOXCA|nr:Proteasome activator complex subunit 3 [Toxocara canis]
MPVEKNSSSPKKQMEAYKEKLLKEAEKIVLEEFPKKVIEFNNLLESGQFSYGRLPELLPDTDLNIPYPNQISESLSDGVPKKRAKLNGDEAFFHGTPVYGFVNGMVKCNEKIAELTDITRPMLRDAVEAVNKCSICRSILYSFDLMRLKQWPKLSLNVMVVCQMRLSRFKCTLTEIDHMLASLHYRPIGNSVLVPNRRS